MPSPFLDALDGVREPRRPERLLLVLGDQLDRAVPGRLDLDPDRDAVLFVEARGEAEHVPSHRQRTVLFLAAMRHFAVELAERGFPLRYVRLDAPGNTGDLGREVERALTAIGPRRLLVVTPGEHRVARLVSDAAEAAGVPLEEVADRHFTCPLEDFDRWATGRTHLVMEHFYRWRRKTLGVLVRDGKPEGGSWNYDAENRRPFREPPHPPRPYRGRPDAITREVMGLVAATFPDAPGKVEPFPWPVTPAEARRALDRFVETRLAGFGDHQDAMWTGEPFLYHSLLSSSLNLKLLDPRDCVDAAVAAYRAGNAPLNAVEGFVRQIIGWREFIRGVYHREGPGYRERNTLGHDGRLPGFFWTGDTELACLRSTIGEVLEHGYGHHIARLMVIGNFCLGAGIDPGEIDDWFLAMYVDAVDWVTAPNVVGMSQHADDGVVGTKPYLSTGKYVDRMSNYCAGCRFHPERRTGEDACPLTTFYWDFLLRHEARFRDNPRMGLAYRNVDRLDDEERKAIRRKAEESRRRLGVADGATPGSPAGSR